MPSSLFGGGQMPFMMAQMPSQHSGQESSTQQGGIPMNLMGQFPAMMQMQQPMQGQGSGMQGAMQGGMQGGMPMGYMMMSP